MMSKEAMKLALEALECTEYPQDHYDAITALREALAEQPAQQEPVAWINQANLNSAAIQRNRGGQGDTHTWSETPTWDHSVPLYTSPTAQRTWVGLTNEDLANCSGHEVRWALYWEKLLKERNT